MIFVKIRFCLSVDVFFFLLKFIKCLDECIARLESKVIKKLEKFSFWHIQCYTPTTDGWKMEILKYFLDSVFFVAMRFNVLISLRAGGAKACDMVNWPENEKFPEDSSISQASVPSIKG